MAANYITTLRDQLTQERRARLALLDGISDIERYLNLPKFHHDPTVQKADIFHRLQDARNAADEAFNQII